MTATAGANSNCRRPCPERMFAITGPLLVTPSGERAGSRTSRVAHCQGPKPNNRDTSREDGSPKFRVPAERRNETAQNSSFFSIFYLTFRTSGANFHSISVAWQGLTSDVPHIRPAFSPNFVSPRLTTAIGRKRVLPLPGTSPGMTPPPPCLEPASRSAPPDAEFFSLSHRSSMSMFKIIQ